MQLPSKDNSGEKIFVRKKDLPDKYKVKPTPPAYTQSEMSFAEEQGISYVGNLKDLDEYAFDCHDHLIVKHDLFNHDGLTQDGIAEAFAQFAAKEGLSFF